MKRYLLAMLSLMMALVISGCGSNSKVDGTSDTGSLITDIKLSEMQVSGDNFSASLTFTKEVDSSYKVTLDHFNLTVAGCTLSNVLYTPESIVLDGEKGTYAQLVITGERDANCTNEVYTFSALQTTEKDGQIDERMFTAVSDQTTDDGTTQPAPSNGFYNVTTPLSVTRPDTHYDIKLQVVSDGYAVSGQEVALQVFDSKYGYISKPTQVTGDDGYAVFDYLSPSTLPAQGTSTSITFTMERNGTLYTQNVVLEFNAENVTTTDDYELTNLTSPLVVSYDSELKTISADVVDSYGIGVEGVEVAISAVSGVEYGSIISASRVTTDQSGHAIFTYKAPENVAAVDGNETTVEVSMINESGTRIVKDITIQFKKIDVTVAKPIVVIMNTYREINLTQNNQNVSMEVEVFEEGTNNPYTSGNVRVSLPDKVLDGVDIGSFAEYTVPVGSDGKAVFNYTGPQDLQALIDAGDLNTTFMFYHESNPTQQESITVIYDLTSDYVPANYLLSVSSTDGDQTMGLNMFKSFAIYLKDDQDELVDSEDISKITITTKNSSIGQLIDTENDGALADSITFDDENATNSKSFLVQTTTLSGLLPVEITIEFTDGNGEVQTLTQVINIVVFSGPPTALSISYAGVEQNTTTAKYIEKFVVTVTDAYNNAVNTRPYISTGSMVEYAVDGSSADGERTETSPRLWHGANDSLGTLEAIDDNKAQFTSDDADIFQYIDISNDKLVLFGAGYVYEALGKWDIESSNGSDTLSLVDDYYGDDRRDLYFAVGHNNRQDLCSNDGREYVGNMKASQYQLDETGHAFIEFEYDYHLTGKDIMVWVNLTGFQADNNHTGRIGEAQKHTLRGYGLLSEDKYSVSDQAIVRFDIRHENAPEWYKNGHFAFSPFGTCTVNGITDWSNLHDARDCNNTIGYVELNVTNDTTSDQCSIYIDGVVVSPEFSGVSSY